MTEFADYRGIINVRMDGSATHDELYAEVRRLARELFARPYMCVIDGDTDSEWLHWTDGALDICTKGRTGSVELRHWDGSVFRLDSAHPSHMRIPLNAGREANDETPNP